MSWQSDFSIAATRKVHPCCACNGEIARGEPAVYFAALDDGYVISVHYHPECRAAEIDWNKRCDAWGEDWSPLSGILEDDDFLDGCGPDWLVATHPLAAARLGL